MVTARTSSVSTPLPTTNGRIADVAAFFRVSCRTVKRWKQAQRIGGWRAGGRAVFTEEDVVRLKADGYVATERLSVVEAAERARREWREHLALRAEGPRSKDQDPSRIAVLEARVERLEKLLGQSVN